MAKGVRWTAAICVVAAMLVAACGGSGSDNASTTRGPSSRSHKSPIGIRAAIAQSGFLAPFDLPPYTAAQFAVDDINAKGGVLGRKLKLVATDMKSDPSQGPQAALDVLGQGADLVIVSCDFDTGSPAATTAT